MPTGAWRRTFPLWEVYFGMAWLTTVALTFIDPGRYAPVVIGSQLGLAAWYLAYGRRLIRDEDEGWRGWVYLAGAGVLLVPIVALSSFGTVILFALSPQPFMVLRYRPAAAAAAGLNAIPPMVLYLRTGDAALVARTALPIAVLATVMTAVLAGATLRTLRQSNEQQALIEELESTRARLAEVSHQAGVAAERARLAGDIHDTVAQGLSSVIMLMQAADAAVDRTPELAHRHIALAARTAREQLAEVRAVVAALTPGPLTRSSLVDAIGRLVRGFTTETGVPASSVVEGVATPLPTAIEVVLLRAVQESLANASKHAAATAVTVRLAFGAAVVVEIRDDGAGFDPHTMTSTGYGLAGMRTRTEQVGGELTVDSTSGAGTAVRVRVPVAGS